MTNGKVPGMRFIRHAAVVSSLLLLVAIPTLTATGAARAEQAREHIAAALRTGDLPVPLVRFSIDELRDFYAGRDHTPLWVGDARADARLDALLGALGSAARDGLRPEAYPVEMPTASSANRPALEVEFHATRALLRYAFDLREGRVTPQQGDPSIHVAGEVVAPADLLRRFAASHDPSAFLAGLASANPHYRRLRRALAEYRAIARAGGWSPIPDGPTLRQGESGPRVATLHTRLLAGGDLTGASREPEVFGDRLHQAVVRFQRRHGLDADGVVGAKTLAALNSPVEERIAQIRLNMERWRWFPDDLGDRHVLVNMAGFELEVVEAGSVAMDMRVVVGRPYRQTPAFSDRIRYLEFNPTWTIPPGILRNDILPKLREDPGYLAANEMRLYPGWSEGAQPIDPHAVDWSGVDPRRLPYRIVQAPGAKNALGRVKFMFPNRFNVYLHDTPSRELFAKTERIFSSGCIRVEKPLELAAYLLGDDPAWTRKRIDEVVSKGRRTSASLKEPVPVHLIYATAWIGEGGTIHFRPDVYGRDARLRQALAGVAETRG